MVRNKALGDYVRRLILRFELKTGQRLSQTEIARRVGKSQAAVHKIMRGRSNARPETLRALAGEFGTDEDYSEMMLLAGHTRLQTKRSEISDETKGALARCIARVTEEIEESLLEPIAAIVGVPVEELREAAGRRLGEVEQELVGSSEADGKFRELWKAARQLPDDAFRRVLEFALFECHRLESQE